MNRKLALALLLLSASAAAQNSAIWIGNTGEWNNANQWLCAVNGVNIGGCIPGAGYSVDLSTGSVSIPVDVGVSRIFDGSALQLLSNHILTATDPFGIQVAGDFQAAAGSTIDSAQLGSLTLELTSATVNGNVSANTATITGSQLGSISVGQQLTAANSTFGSSSTLQLTQNSSLSASTIGGTLFLSGPSLTVGSGSLVNAISSSVTSGALTIQGGSTWNESSAPIFLGLAPGSSSLDVTGHGSAVNLTGTDLELGEIGNASATVEKTATLTATNGNLLIGLGVGPFVTQSSLSVTTGGSVSALGITVEGGSNGSTGTLMVDGSGSSVTTSGEMLVTGGGSVTASNQSSLTLNSLRIQTGDVTISSGATLTLTSDSPVLVGSIGFGSLTLRDGGTGTSPGQLVIAGSSGASSVTIDGSGSSFQADGGVVVGYGATGTLNVQNGGALVTGADASGVSGVLGLQSTGAGTATIQGGNWQANGELQIGAGGTGSLQLLQAGTVQSGAATIALNAGSTGSVSVSGVGSQWTVSGDLTVGSSGSGSLSISGGGVVKDVNAVLGDHDGSSGTVTVTGLGSSWQNSGILTVGNDGGASLTVNAGSVIAGGASMGSNDSPVQVDITNHGAMTVLGDLSIGGAAATTVTIENGGTLDSGDHATIGGSGGDTTVTVTGADSAWTLHGAGELTIDDKGSLFVMDSGTVTATSITVDSGGLLNGQGGTVIGDVLNHGGTVTPGDATGIMTINGNYSQTSGSLLFEIDGLGPGEFDQLMISGFADFTGGSIDLLFGNGFVPLAGENFDLIFANAGLTASGLSFDVPGLPSGLQFTDTVGAGGLEVSFEGPSQPTPETAPAGMFLLGIAMILAAALVRRAISVSGR